MDWPNDLIFEFLDLYKEEEQLWNPKNIDYKNKLRIAAGWENIKRNLSQEISVYELKKKKDCLMATYRHLNRKVRQSRRVGRKQAYQPSWTFYNCINQFLRNIYKPKQIDGETPTDGAVRDGKDTEDTGYVGYDPPPNDCEVAASFVAADVSRSKKFKPNESSFSVDPLGGATTRKDDCDIFGELLAVKLRKFDEETRDVIMNEIDNLVFRTKQEYSRRQSEETAFIKNSPDSE